MNVGSFVEWDSSGGTAVGVITQIIKNGEVPNIDVKITGTPEEPAARIQVYREVDGNYEKTNTYVGHKLTELRQRKSLSEEEALTMRQQYLVSNLITTVEYFGLFDKGIGGDGAHYIPASENVFAQKGMACKNCVFFAEDSASCSVVKGEIEEDAACKFWVIEEYELGLAPEPEEDEEDSDPEIMVTEAATPSWKVSGSRTLQVVQDEAWDGDSAKAAIFNLAGFDTDTPNPSIARRGFLVYDASNPTLKGSYKLPFAMVKDGKLVASSAGLRAAASRLPQTDIPEAVMKSAQSILDSYQDSKATSAKYSNISFSPPDGVRSAAKRGLALHEEGLSGSGLEPATVAWARKYVSGDPVSPERARMGNRFFGRNARFANAPKDSPAWVSWLLWGGSAGRAWFSSLVRQMDNADKKMSTASARGYIKMAEQSSHPLMREVELILTDFEPNANKEGIPLEEAENIIKTAKNTPLKIAASESEYGGHSGAIPVGPITDVYMDTHDGKPVIKARALIWSDEFKQVYELIKSESNTREYVGTSWEVYYRASDKVGEVNWLRDVTFAGTCIVDSPAYGNRTKILKVAEKTQMNSDSTGHDTDLTSKLQQQEAALEELRKQIEAYENEAKERALAEKKATLGAHLAQSGLSEPEVEAVIPVFLQFDEATATMMLGLLAKRTVAQTKPEETRPMQIPNPLGSLESPTPDVLAKVLKGKLNKK
jgi:hypothetical protein